MSRRGLRASDDVAVTGFDDSPPAVFSTPAITSVRQPIEAIERKLERDTYMSAEEARDFGLIDQVVEQRPAAPGAETKA